MGPHRSTTPNLRLHSPDPTNAIMRLMLPILPYTGAGTATTESATEEASAVDLTVGAEGPLAATPTSSPVTRRRHTDPDVASWSLAARSHRTATDAHDAPPPAYDELFGPPPARRAHSLSEVDDTARRGTLLESASISACSATLGSSDQGRARTSRPPARRAQRSFDSGYASAESAGSCERERGAGSRSSCDAGTDGGRNSAGATGGTGGMGGLGGRKPSVLKRVGRTLSRELSRPWSHGDGEQLGYAAPFG